jgi:hypothetical protein
MRVFLVVASISLLVGCSSPNEPPPPTTPVSTAPVRPTTHGRAPEVSRTVSITPHLANPCDLLAKEDLAALSFGDRYVTVPSDPEWKDRNCEVGGGSGGGILHLTLEAEISPLAQAYDDTSSKYEFFEPVEIAGFPALKRALSVKYPGDCQVIVGTGAKQGVVLEHGPRSSSGGTEGICNRLVKTAEAVMKRLGG